MSLKMKYFVLEPVGDSAYGTASREAMLRFADCIRHTDPEFADEILAWRDKALIETYGSEEDAGLEETSVEEQEWQ